MSTSTAIVIKAGVDILISIWGALENKPAGWEPSEQDWQNQLDEVDAATPEARLALAKLRALKFTTTATKQNK